MYVSTATRETILLTSVVINSPVVFTRTQEYNKTYIITYSSLTNIKRVSVPARQKTDRSRQSTLPSSDVVFDV